MFTRCRVPATAQVSYVCSLLSSLPGWAGHAAWRSRQSGQLNPLLELVALHAALDLLIAGSAGELNHYVLPQHPLTAKSGGGWERRRQIWQLAFETGFRAPLIESLRSRALQQASAGTGQNSITDVSTEPPLAHLVFCIDVRSERLRRALESAGPYVTHGFAGFFGATLDYRTADGASFEQCPALVRPSIVAAEHGPSSVGRTSSLTSGLYRGTRSASSGPVTPLLIAEAGGLLAAAAGLLQTMLPRRWQQVVRRWNVAPSGWGSGPLTLSSSEGGLPLSTAERTSIAASTLRSLGLVDGFGPLLVICGHAASAENNAFAAAYDCGACGGNSGHVNARVLTEILNDRAVRVMLAGQGIHLPPTTVAIAAVHNTTTDRVEFDPHPPHHPYMLSPPHIDAIEALRADLVAVCQEVRVERASALPGLQAGNMSTTRLERHLQDRAGDWAQPFPEWGLAGNAAFVVGPRSLTRGLDLKGRVFLHDYESEVDADRSLLETILTAPTVVTQWINAQYYASTVDHEVFGAGDKATHNVVGDVGVLTGAHGDLRLGLPWQALYDTDPRTDASSRRHEPLRQLVVVWADPAAVRAIVVRHQVLQRLIGNDWMALVSLDPKTGEVRRLNRFLGWQPWDRSSVLWSHPATIARRNA